ncbi:MAG: hypothetical protein GXP48_03585 [Acidobacteria bacterium]|nr:hypothetical protein [Acidobacteriota bacterium]
MGRLRYVGAALVAVVLAVSPLAAQTWHGEIGLGYAWQNAAGSENSFRSQQALDQGFVLENLDLAMKTGQRRRFHLQAWGFGQAEPTEHGRLSFAPGENWSMAVSYDRRDTFFGLSGSDLGARTDRWNITRWGGRVTWTGWSAAKLTLNVRHVERNGTVFRPFYGLNNLYPLRVGLDETMDQGSLRLVTRSLPVVLDVEAIYSTYDRRNRWSPAGSFSLDPTDLDRLTDVGTTMHESQDVPSGRATASYARGRVETVFSVLWSSADLDATGAGWKDFAVDEGRVGTIQFLDDLVGSASTDTLAGAYRLALRLGGPWRLRFSADYRDASSDSSLLGERLLKALNPTGAALELSTPIDDTGRFDTTDTSGRLEVEYRTDRWSVWAGGLAASRDVTWRLTKDGNRVDVSRDSGGAVAGASINLGRWLRGSVEYEHGSFQEYVFRTDPNTVNRVTVRISSHLNKTWVLNVHGRYEGSDNPRSISDLSTNSTAIGAALMWSPAGGNGAFGVDASILDLSTDTGLILPTGDHGTSLYDTSVRRLSTFARIGDKSRRLTCRLAWLTDQGETWPVDAWNAAVRFDFTVFGRLMAGVFGQYWSYDEKRARVDDFSVTRYGLALHWSF